MPLVYLVSAFTEDGEGGNKAGVVLGADELTAAQKQSIAHRIGYSETAFVSSSEKADFKLEFFTPTRQVPHCGHATLATFTLLYRTNRLSCPNASKETIEDVRKITFQNDIVFMEQKKPAYRDLSDAETSAVLDSLGIGDGYLAGDPAVVSTGNPWLVIPLRTDNDLRELLPDQEAIRRISEELGAVGYYAYGALPTENHLRARMFAPLFGIDEESATGSAAGPAACLAYDRLRRVDSRVVIRQGHHMTPPSPSRIRVQLNVAGGEVQNLLVGGDAVIFGKRELEIE